MAPRLQGPQDRTLTRAQQTLSWGVLCLFFCKYHSHRRPATPSPDLDCLLSTQGPKGEELEAEMQETSCSLGTRAWKGQESQGMGRDHRSSPSAWMSVSWAGNERDALPWATCMLGQGKKWVKGLSG